MKVTEENYYVKLGCWGKSMGENSKCKHYSASKNKNNHKFGDCSYSHQTIIETFCLV